MALKDALAHLDALLGSQIEVQPSQDSPSIPKETGDAEEPIAFRLFSNAPTVSQLTLEPNEPFHGLAQTQDPRIRDVEDLPKKEQKRLRKQAKAAAVDLDWLEAQRSQLWVRTMNESCDHNNDLMAVLKPQDLDPARVLPPITVKTSHNKSQHPILGILKRRKRVPRLTQAQFTLRAVVGKPIKESLQANVKTPASKSSKRPNKRFSKQKRMALKQAQT